jgi:hypothetical protein
VITSDHHSVPMTLVLVPIQCPYRLRNFVHYNQLCLVFDAPWCQDAYSCKLKSFVFRTILEYQTHLFHIMVASGTSDRNVCSNTSLAGDGEPTQNNAFLVEPFEFERDSLLRMISVSVNWPLLANDEGTVLPASSSPPRPPHPSSLIDGDTQRALLLAILSDALAISDHDSQLDLFGLNNNNPSRGSSSSSRTRDLARSSPPQ